MLASGLLMSYPAALHVTARPVPEAVATVVFVHGSLDRGDSFRRVMRRLPDVTAVAYDRRGYQGSRGGGVVGLGGHIEDLLAVMEEARRAGGRGRGRPVVAVGHSLGGDVVMGAALAEPARFDAIGVYEPPMPWLGFRRDGGGGGGGAARPWHAVAEDPGEEAELFFTRMVGASSWARLTDAQRESRRADGPALVADLRSFRREVPPFDVTELEIPAVFGMGGPTSRPHHRRTVQWLGANVSTGVVYEVEGAQHGAHLSHPDHFALMTRLVIERATNG